MTACFRVGVGSRYIPGWIRRTLALASAGGVWASHRTEYQLERYSSPRIRFVNLGEVRGTDRGAHVAHDRFLQRSDDCADPHLFELRVRDVGEGVREPAHQTIEVPLGIVERDPGRQSSHAVQEQTL